MALFGYFAVVRLFVGHWLGHVSADFSTDRWSGHVIPSETDHRLGHVVPSVHSATGFLLVGECLMKGCSFCLFLSDLEGAGCAMFGHYSNCHFVGIVPVPVSRIRGIVIISCGRM